MHLPDHVTLITSEHHGTELALLYTLWADWIQVFEYDDRDELTDAMLDAGDCFQATAFKTRFTVSIGLQYRTSGA